MPSGSCHFPSHCVLQTRRRLAQAREAGEPISSGGLLQGSLIAYRAAAERRMRIGIAGIGNLGSAIGPRLMDVGHALTVWNRTAEKTKPLAAAGAAVARTAAELASSVDVVISVLIDAAAIDAVYNGPQG